MAEKLKAAAGSFERLLLPRLNSIDGELKAINTRITEGDARHAEKIDSVEKVLRAEFRSLDTRVSEMDKRLSSKLDEMDRKLDIDRRMTIIEAKLKDLEKGS